MKRDINLVKENISTMLSKGAPEKDVDAYVASEGYTPEELRGSNGQTSANENPMGGLFLDHPPAIAKAVFGLKGGQGPGGKYTNVRDVVGDVIRMAPWVFNPAPEVSIPAKMAMTGAMNFGANEAGNLMQGDTSAKGALESGEQGGAAALMQGALGKAGPIATKAIQKGYNTIKPGLSDVISTLGSFLSSVPKGDYQRATDAALEGKSIFGKSLKEDQNSLLNLADKAKAAAKDYRNKFGEEVGGQKNTLKEEFKKTGSVPLTDGKSIVKDVDEMIANTRTTAGNTSIDPQDLQTIQDYQMELRQPKLPIDEANRIKNQINDRLYASKRTNGRLSIGEGILAQMAEKLDNEVKVKAPQLYGANKAAGNAIKASDFITSKLNDEQTKGTNLFSSVKNEKPIADVLGQVDSVAPKNLQFMDELKDVIARAPFRHFLPGQGGGSGSAQGAGNIARGIAVRSGEESIGKFPASILSGVFSPAVNKGAIKGLAAMVNTAPKFSQTMARFAPPAAAAADNGQLVNMAYQKKLEEQKAKGK